MVQVFIVGKKKLEHSEILRTPIPHNKERFNKFQVKKPHGTWEVGLGKMTNDLRQCSLIC